MEGGLSGFLRGFFGGGPKQTAIAALAERQDSASIQLLQDYLQENSSNRSENLDLKASESGRILALDERGQLNLVFAACVVSARNQQRDSSADKSEIEDEYSRKVLARKLFSYLMRRQLPFTQNDLALLVLFVSELTSLVWTPLRIVLRAVANQKEKDGGFTLELRAALERLRVDLANGRYHESKALLKIVDELLREGPASRAPLKLTAGEAWSDAALADLAEMTPEHRNAWTELLYFAQTAEGTRPAKKWLAAAAACVKTVGQKEFSRHVSKWMPLIEKPRTQQLPPPGPDSRDENLLIVEPHADILKGLAWCCCPMDDPILARALGDAAIAAYKKIRWQGPRCKKLANAAVVALSSMPGTEPVAQLGRLNTQAKHASSRKYVARRLDDVAERTGQTTEDLTELAIPTFDLDSNGTSRRTLGDFTAELAITGSTDAEIRWLRSDGKPQRSIPADLKRDHADALKELQRTCKDIKKMLPAQRARIERLLMTERQWPFQTWRERYFDQPLLANLSRRLIWEFITGANCVTGAQANGKIVTHEDRPVSLDSQTQVRLWHPIRSPTDVALGWRNWLERHEIRQPFKQAHREIYVLTDAERQTRMYSNRFAAHILRQHQLAALCQDRGWEYRLQGGFDSHNSPTLRLPEHDLGASFWIEPAEQNQTSGAGIYLYVATDQVRFFRNSFGEQLPVEQVPPLLFSEIMRNVDFFVGVASVGNDPNWRDGAQTPGLDAYWQRSSFGDLGESAKTRKAVLERLIPRLKIADRCTFSERFLVVRGDIRKYKIHLGSGNILMEPLDQYLCIVASRGTSDLMGGLFLPFEGDVTLSIIISKALMLADDKRIKDPTIRTQIGH